MRCYASTNLGRLGTSRWDAIDAELVGESSDLCVCRALHLEGGGRHHGKILVGGRRRELLYIFCFFLFVCLNVGICILGLDLFGFGVGVGVGKYLAGQREC